MAYLFAIVPTQAQGMAITAATEGNGVTLQPVAFPPTHPPSHNYLLQMWQLTMQIANGILGVAFVNPETGCSITSNGEGQQLAMQTFSFEKQDQDSWGVMTTNSNGVRIASPVNSGWYWNDLGGAFAPGDRVGLWDDTNPNSLWTAIPLMQSVAINRFLLVAASDPAMAITAPDGKGQGVFLAGRTRGPKGHGQINPAQIWEMTMQVANGVQGVAFINPATTNSITYNNGMSQLVMQGFEAGSVDQDCWQIVTTETNAIRIAYPGNTSWTFNDYGGQYTSGDKIGLFDDTNSNSLWTVVPVTGD